jgi:hypothetical protein
MRKESQNKVTMKGREFGLEDPELQLPNSPQIPNSKLGTRLISDNVDAFSRCRVERSEKSRTNAFQKSKKKSSAPLRMTIAGRDLDFGF